MKRLLFLVPLVAFAVLAGYFAIGLTKDPHKIPSALLDRPMPPFDLPPLANRKEGLSTDQIKGKVALVNVFASWCVPCRIEHPLLMRLAAEGRIPVYGINYKDKPEDATKWLAELGDPYGRIGADLDGRAGIDWGVYGVPETFVIDREGRIRYKQVGQLSPEVLRDTILPLVRKLEQ
jgi:cytochrome c biogenesis protein CcmG/thiol:disulfide interchange protein DsbE